MNDLFSEIGEIRKRGINAALCIVVNTRGSAPRVAGTKMLVYEDGKISGTIGGGNLEKKVIENALAVIKNKNPKLFRHDLLHQHNMCCGGSVDIYIEPVMKKNKLYIFGAGHTGQALATLAQDFDFEIVLIDDRKEYIDACEINTVNKMNLPFSQALQLLPFDDHTYNVILTYQHDTDREILAHCLGKPNAYIGMIGSRRKIEITKKMFVEAGVSSLDLLEKVDMPMGLDIHAETPQEIAASILAKLIKVKNANLKNQYNENQNSD